MDYKTVMKDNKVVIRLPISVPIFLYNSVNKEIKIVGENTAIIAIITSYLVPTLWLAQMI